MKDNVIFNDISWIEDSETLFSGSVNRVNFANGINDIGFLQFDHQEQSQELYNKLYQLYTSLQATSTYSEAISYDLINNLESDSPYSHRGYLDKYYPEYKRAFERLSGNVQIEVIGTDIYITIND